MRGYLPFVALAMSAIACEGILGIRDVPKPATDDASIDGAAVHEAGPGDEASTGDCATGQERCGQSCVNTATSAAHCGGCWKACNAGESCSASACTCPTIGAACPGGMSCTRTGCAGWARWKMPNAPDSGAPTTADYDATQAGVVVDKVTGLMWQAQVTGIGRNWPMAEKYCADLSLAGLDDWRLPTRVELVSIMDPARSPAIASVFPALPGGVERFWTASRATREDFRWIVSGSGAVYYSGPTSEFHVRCVRKGG
jgi:hypothetical protein